MRTRLPRLLVTLWMATAGVTTLFVGPALGQSPPSPAGASDPYDVTRPVGAVRAFIDACRDGDYLKAAGRLNLAGLPEDASETDGQSLARQLKTVLDRKLWIQYELLGQTPEGDLDDGLPPNLDRVGSIDGAEILLERLTEEDGRRVWKFAGGTVASIPDLSERYGYGKLGEILPAPMFEISFLEMQLWQWLILAPIAIVAWLASWIVAWVVLSLLQPVVARTETTIDDQLLKALAVPFRYGVALVMLGLSSLALALSVPAEQFLSRTFMGLSILVGTWFAMRVVDIATNAVRQHLEDTDRKAVIAVVPLGRRVVKVFLFAIALVLVLQNLGFNVTGLIAGLGVGGLAVALAAQKSVANLFGGVSMIADQPVRVGDFCRYGGDKVGTVEEIGLRSTRVRSLDRTLVTIPNAEFSEMQLENFAARDRMRLYTTLGLRYETSPDQIRAVLAEIRKLLVGHPRITPEPARVRFVGFGAYSLDLEIFAYVDSGDYNEFLQIREDVFLRIMDVIESCGTGFAFPSQTLYLGRDGGLDEEQGREAETRVREWRERGELPIPDYPEQALKEMDGTLDYPAAGSALGVSR